MRWQQFDTLVRGKAPMAEPGLALGLHYRVADDKASGKKAVEWAMAPNSEVRQVAMVYDWCRELLSPQQEQAMAAKLKGAATNPYAAVALGDSDALELFVKQWKARHVAGRKAGKRTLPREDNYALYELLHMVRDNTNYDLRESDPGFFKMLPVEHLLSHYPPTYPGPDGEYHIPASASGEPDLKRAALGRAAGFAMVAYDTNSPEAQVLQGWLMNDHFQLRGTFGAPYEFLWANPYQPGLSYFHVPLIFHDERFGTLFVRSTWDEDATWLGYFDGRLQLFSGGKLTTLNAALNNAPISLKEAVIFFGRGRNQFVAAVDEEDEVFVLGLKPRQRYEVEVDDQELREYDTDGGGILKLDLPRKSKTGVRWREAPVAAR